jgi:hypothetical protein
MADTDITVKYDEITIDDLVLMEDIGDGKASLRDMRDFLNRVIEGGAGKRKAGELRKLAEAVSLAVSEIANPKEVAEVSS